MSILIPTIAVTIIGIICGVILVASKFMSSAEDEIFVMIRECLPGANCGSCGYAGCDGYAHALSDEETENAGLCIPGGSTVATQVAKILGINAQEVEKTVAFVACGGNSACTTKRYVYEGIQTCAASKLLFAGDKSCSYGCLGRGDCASVCPNNAIFIKDGLASVDRTVCTGCGMCAKVCPNQIIRFVKAGDCPIVRCSSQDKGAITRKACLHGCIGCKKCEKLCRAGAITVTNNIATIEPEKCIKCGLCKEACTTGCIIVLQDCF